MSTTPDPHHVPDRVPDPIAPPLASRAVGRPVRHLPVRTMPEPDHPTLPVRLAARGQATAEYALVLLGAAAVALMLTAWAAKSGMIGRLFDAVVGQLIDKAG